MTLGRKHSASKAKRRRAAASKRAATRRQRGARLRKAILCVLVGALLLALALVVGDAEYHATAIGWIPFVAYVLLVVFAWVYLQLLKRGLSFEELVKNNDCVRDSSVPFKVVFHNKTPLFFFKARVLFVVRDLFGNPANSTETCISLAPHEDYEMGFDMRFVHVGRYEAGLDRVLVSDFLGLFTYEVSNKQRKTICVNPKIWPIGKLDFSEDAMEDSEHASKAVLADSMDYAYVREYVPGDPLKTIHWKLSARAGEYMTRLFEVYTNPGVAVFMDFFAPVDDADDLMGVYDAVIESGFSVARYAQQEGMDTVMHYITSLGEEVQLDSWGEDDVTRFIEDVPVVSNEASHAEDALKLLRSQTAGQYGQNNIVVCTSNFSPEMIQVVLAAKLSGRTPLVIGVVPLSVVDRDREDYCKPLLQLEAAGVDYMIVSRSNEMRGVVA